MIQCYNCGKYFDKKETNKEHIPAKGLFEGYPVNYKDNRVTVRSCINCNSSYSKDDEEFRNMIGTMNSEKERAILSAKTAKAIIAINKQYDRIIMDISGKIKGVEFDEANIDRFHIKNFKGIFYREYNYAVPTEFKVNLLTEPTDNTYDLIHYLVDNFKWKKSGHRDVFEYIIQPLRELEQPFIDIKPNDNDNVILAFMKYNNSHAALAFAIK